MIVLHKRPNDALCWSNGVAWTVRALRAFIR